MSSLLVLPMQGFYLSVSAPKAVAQQQTSQLSQEQLKKIAKIAKSITVRIISGNKGGSGTLVKKEGSLFTVITNRHVLEPGKPHLIQTADSRNYQGEVVKGVNFGSRDLVLLQFRSNANYPVASFGKSALKLGDDVYAAGFPFKDSPSEARQFDFKSGQVSSLLGEKKLQGGYGIGYTNNIQKGMSGGPLLNNQGQLVGINGIQAQPLWGNPYKYEDNTQPNDTLRQEMKSSSWGIPIEILAESAPQFVAAQVAQQSGTAAKASTVPKLTNQVDSIAKEITVFIDSVTDQGSGVIVAKEGNTYYVLTAGHVTSVNKQITVFTPDGKEYPVDISKVKTWRGIDVVLLQFTSNERYQVATLGNYGLDSEDQVIFVSGFTKAKQTNVKPSRQLSAGFLLGWSSTYANARDDRSFSTGYGLVYTNLTVRGMSGGPVLDVDGNLIGIHTAAEAEDLETKTNKRTLELGYSLGVPIRAALAKLKQENTQFNFTYKSCPGAQKSCPPSKLTAAQQDEIVTASLNLKQPESSSDEIEWLNFGNKLWRLRRYREAEQAFDKAITKKQNFPEAWYAHGMALKLQNNYNLAIQSFRKAISYYNRTDSEQLSQAWRQVGDSFWYLGEYEEARKFFLKAIDFRPDDFILYSWLGQALMDLGRYREALEEVNKSLRINHNLLDSYIQLSKIHESLQDYSAAIDDINKALELQPDLAFGYAHRGYLHSLQEDYTEALADLNKAIELQPKYFDAYSTRGQVYARMGNPQKFDEDFQQALRLKPNSTDIYSSRGDAYSLLGDTQKAIDDYTQAIRLSPKYELAYQFLTQRGSVRYKNEDYQGAIKDYNQALSYQPNYVPAYLRRGDAYAKLGKRQESMRDFDKAVSLQPDNPFVYSRRGNARYILKDNNGGMEDYKIAIDKARPYLADLFYAYRARARDEQKDYPGAIEDYSQAITLKPKKAEFYRARALVRSNQKDYQGAIADYSQAITLKPNKAEFYLDRAWVRYEQEEYKGAIADLSQVIQIKPKKAEFYSYRALVRSNQKDYQGAIADYSQAIKLKRNDSQFYHDRAAVRLYQEDYQGVIEDMTIAINLKPDFADAYYGRGWANQMLNNKQAAIKDLQKAAQLAHDQSDMVVYKAAQDKIHELTSTVESQK
ncbi:MAG: tetratricopeptide repeat protein [Aetokthonos hydrillicola CCALA 1050]|nr:tetratricopeptide repeat protein [Aetokthonos hydrillicola CCALA 1050]MBW4587506.1 tetratricopeptide repeat protein [Aetokthonos hydrillicola CCALA 1050]